VTDAAKYGEKFQETDDCQPDENGSEMSTSVSGGLSDSKSVLEDDWLSVDAKPKLMLSPVMFEALPSNSQAALLSVGSAHLARQAYVNADVRTEAWTSFVESIHTEALYSTLIASMPDHYED